MDYLGVTVDETGISAPPFETIIASLKTKFQAIYGNDIYLDADSQDGQMLAMLATCINDANNGAIAVYNQFSPATAQGAGLSSNVKLNGITRHSPSNSTCDVLVVGVAGTVIANGAASDGANKWLLPVSVTIPNSGQITVTATCSNVGAISAPSGTITQIATPTYGWQSVSNPSAAAVGNPVEDDSALRKRQAISVANPASTVLTAIAGGVANLSGVTSVHAYENDTNSTDANGLPPHSITLVVNGGDSTQIATAIALRKTEGCYTNGTTLVAVPDTYGNASNIRFYRPTLKNIAVAITLKALSGYTSVIGEEVKAAVAAYISGLDVGASVMQTRVISAACLGNTGNGTKYEVTALTIGIVSGSLSTADIVNALYEMSQCATSNITLTVV